MSILEKYRSDYQERQEVEMSIMEYLEQCREDKSMYANAAERMLAAIGEPKIIDTRLDERLSRIYSNKKLKTYPDSFADFYGMESVIEQVVAFFRHAAQGLEESKQILYLLGPVGGGKSSIAERLKKLMQTQPFYVLRAYNTQTEQWETSPCLESPLGLFDADDVKEFNIPARYTQYILSPWGVKRLKEAEGDLDKFSVVKMYPSILKQQGVTKTEPGDENNQDISNLVGKINIRKLEDYDQADPDAYGWSGGLNLTTQGILDYVEMFKSPIKMLNPLLTATQDGHYNGTEQFGAIPYQGILMAHSNESEWKEFRNNNKNEAFLDRVNLIKVPYCLSVGEEEKIYKKLVDGSELAQAPCAPNTLNMLAQFSVLSRLVEPENSSIFSKMEIYDGKNLKNRDPKAKSITEYRDMAGVNEGMSGSSTRFAFKVLSKVFNYDTEEVSANPIHLMYVLEQTIRQENLPEAEENKLLDFIFKILAPKYAEFLGDEIQKAYLESYHDYGQNLFDRYIQYADFWIQDKDYRDPDTGEMFDRENLNQELEKIEKAAGIVNPKDFRNETVGYVIRYRANHNGESPDWTGYEKLREVIEKKMFTNTEELLPVISFSKKATADEDRKHNEFIERMKAKGYTLHQIRTSVDWFMRYQQNN